MYLEEVEIESLLEERPFSGGGTTNKPRKF